MKKYYLAIDIGASSGRHIVGWRDGEEIQTEEVYRFPNGVKEESGHLTWDIAALFISIKKGIAAAFKKYPKIESLAIDTWAVDYVLLHGDREILPCYAYRDKRTERTVPLVHERVPFDELYQKTGIQFQPFNTIYQFYDDLVEGRLKRATDFLMLPEYLSYKLTGVKVHEYTNATTTGLLNARGEYDAELISKLGFPKKLFGKISQPKTAIGQLLPDVAKEVGGNCEVILCASHDTASAVEGIPMPEVAAYISSGTWSLLGAKVPNVIADAKSRKANYSNEGGVGYIRYQKNIMGQWVVNRLREELCPNKPFSEIEAEARTSKFCEFVDVNDPVFLAPKSMKEAFDSWLKNGEKPQTEQDYFKCAFLSLAMSYMTAIEELEANLQRRFDAIYIVGGGAKNAYLNALTEDACKRNVIALPIEATALGNLKLQMERTV